jgi:hypothetical protein
MIKGTMPLDLFLMELRAVMKDKPDLYEKIFESKLKGALNNKLARLEEEGCR